MHAHGSDTLLYCPSPFFNFRLTKLHTGISYPTHSLINSIAKAKALIFPPPDLHLLHSVHTVAQSRNLSANLILRLSPSTSNTKPSRSHLLNQIIYYSPSPGQGHHFFYVDHYCTLLTSFCTSSHTSTESPVHSLQCFF